MIASPQKRDPEADSTTPSCRIGEDQLVHLRDRARCLDLNAIPPPKLIRVHPFELPRGSGPVLRI